MREVANLHTNLDTTTSNFDSLFLQHTLIIGRLSMPTGKNTGRLRLLVQLIFFLIIMWISLAHTFGWWGGENLHGLCPFGGVATLYTFITTGDFIRHLGQSNYILIIALLATLAASGSFFCGWICPLGSVQEWFGKLGKKIFGKKYNQVPSRLDNILSYFRYVVLILVIVQTARSFTIVFERFDPYYNLFNIWTDEIAVTGYISVGIILTASLYVERPFCRYACPLGALNGLFNYFSFLNIRRNKDSCIDCGACDRACPVNIEVSKIEKVNDSSCVRCMKCVESCPVNSKTDTLTISLPGKRSKAVKGTVYGIALLLLFAAPIGIATGMGVFGLEEEGVYETIEDIRGSYTIEEIVNNYDIDKATFYRACGLNKDINTTKKINALKDTNGCRVGDIREVVEGINQPISTIATELPKGINPEMSVREFITTQDPGTITSLLAEDEEEIVLDETGKEIEIKRKTLLVTIKNSVKDFEDFKESFNIPGDITLNTSIRDLEKEYGISITEIKEYVAEHGR